MEKKKNGISMEPNVEYKSQFKNNSTLREEKNAAIHKKVLWFLIGMFVLVGIVMMTKYSLTGSATISVGVITAIILRNVQRLKEGYEYDASQPRWFRITLVYTAIFGTLIGFVVCKMLADYVYNISNGSITPWRLFVIVAVIMSIVHLSCRKLRRGKEGREQRAYTFLMVISICLIISQCVGSISSSKSIDLEQWEKSKRELDLKDDGYRKKVVGTWVTNAGILGTIQETEIFGEDGTWQRGDTDGIQSKGRWAYMGCNELKIHEDMVIVGGTRSPSDNTWILEINYLRDDEMCVKKDEYIIIYKRAKVD